MKQGWCQFHLWFIAIFFLSCNSAIYYLINKHPQKKKKVWLRTREISQQRPLCLLAWLKDSLLHPPVPVPTQGPRSGLCKCSKTTPKRKLQSVNCYYRWKNGGIQYKERLGTFEDIRDEEEYNETKSVTPPVKFSGNAIDGLISDTCWNTQNKSEEQRQCWEQKKKSERPWCPEAGFAILPITIFQCCSYFLFCDAEVSLHVAVGSYVKLLSQELFLALSGDVYTYTYLCALGQTRSVAPRPRVYTYCSTRAPHSFPRPIVQGPYGCKYVI